MSNCLNDAAITHHCIFRNPVTHFACDTTLWCRNCVTYDVIIFNYYLKNDEGFRWRLKQLRWFYDHDVIQSRYSKSNYQSCFKTAKLSFIFLCDDIYLITLEIESSIIGSWINHW